MTIIDYECSVPWGGGGCSVIPQGTHYIPHRYHDTPIVLNIPQNAQGVPHSTHDIPYDIEHSHSTEHTLYRVFICHLL